MFRKKKAKLTVEEIISEAEQLAKESGRREAVTMNFFGDLSVNPDKVYVSSEEGQQALDELRIHRERRERGE